MQITTPANSSLDHTIRGWNDVLALWRHCRKGRCARAGACRGRDAQRCFHAHFALLPDSMIVWFYDLADAQKKGLTYDQAIEGMRDTIAESALEEWHATIDESARFLKSRDRPKARLRAS
jgi:hypothetical protein